jgi:transcriptional regulator with XRE-family HTH domain
MIIGDRLRKLREAKHLSQGDIEKRTGLCSARILQAGKRANGAAHELWMKYFMDARATLRTYSVLRGLELSVKGEH